MDGKSGYLYAMPLGYFPVNGWHDPQSLELRVKLGSFRQPDPVAALHHAYSRPLGRPELWWVEPSPDAVADEKLMLFKSLRSYRVYHNREIFAFASKEACMRILQDFTLMYHRHTAALAKPPYITDLEHAWLPQREAAAEMLRKKQERQRLEQDRLEAKACAQACIQRQRSQSLDQLIQDRFEVGQDFKIEAKVFNELAKAVGVSNVQNAMVSRGFQHKRGRWGESQAVTWLYWGLHLVS